MYPQFVPIEINRGIAVNAIELNVHAFVSPVSRSVECLAIPACPTREKALAWSAGIVLVGLACYAPIVGQVDNAPGNIRERRRLRATRIAEEELPPGIGG